MRGDCQGGRRGFESLHPLSSLQPRPEASVATFLRAINAVQAALRDLEYDLGDFGVLFRGTESAGPSSLSPRLQESRVSGGAVQRILPELPLGFLRNPKAVLI
jgi:hypothetical protein